MVLWRTDLWLASQRGVEHFSGSMIQEPISPQFWAFGAFAHPLHPWIDNESNRWVNASGPMSPHSALVFADSTSAFVMPFYRDEASRNELGCMFCKPQPLNEHLSPNYWPILAGLGFMGLPYVARERASLPRHIRRAAECGRRSGLPEMNTVILRRAFRVDEPREESGESREWSCQWMVGGHWRNQWLPSKATWEPRYIQPYLKGDPTKPLRVKQGTVYHVKR